MSLNESELVKVDSEFEGITQSEETERNENLKTRWAALVALVGSEKRIRLIAEELVQHFKRRLEATEGDATVVCMSHRICVDLCNELSSTSVPTSPMRHQFDLLGLRSGMERAQSNR